MIKISEQNFYVVGIGASAGGLEALKNFFKNISDTTGMAFVVIQHLAPDHDSHMVGLLAKHTQMDICQAKDEMEVKPNSIYLIPPNRNLTLFNNRLYLSPRKSNKYNLNLPIDIFFESLAKAKKDKAIGVILSGTGSDGTRGIRAIKEKNGLVIVQDEKSAKFSAMPKNAEATGLVDYKLSPSKIGETLLEYIDHLDNHKQSSASELPSKETKIDRILAIIKENLNVDFTYYKNNTIIRRLERRMAINQITDIREYIKFLASSREEVETLYRELLIGVTKFFRDKEAFKIIRQEIIPKIVASKNAGDEIRIWVPACSTGEEVYSLAILFKEYIAEQDKDNYNIKIFGTDISDESIRQAGVGKYPESITGEISLNRLQKYFIKQGSNYKISKSIREMTIFSVHNIIEDPPFHKMDLVSCRNLLIYFEPKLQKKVLSLFNFSLQKNGFLFLGSSETIGEAENWFKTYNSKWRIYKSLGKTEQQPQINLARNTDFNKPQINYQNDKRLSNYNLSNKEKNIFDIKEKVIENCLPDTAIINQDNELVHVIGNLNKYLQLPINRLSLNILEMGQQDLSLVLGIAINKAKRNNEKIIYNNVELKENDNLNHIKLTVVPLAEVNDERLLAVSFSENKMETAKGKVVEEEIKINNEDKLRERIKDLERELDYTKENLQATIEELEASNEELQATNEELMASNEELQSTNEELESVNEELITVNAEHQNKIEELTRLTNDMDNLLRSTDIGTLFLDEELKIRKFTPAIKETMNLIESDFNRPLSHITHKFIYDNMLEDAKEVLNTLEKKEFEVQTESGIWYLMKILPYRTESNEIKGIVITLVNVNELKSSNYELQKITYAVEKSPNIIVITDTDGKIEYINQSFCQETGYQKDAIGKKTNLLNSGYVADSTYQNLWQSIKSGEKWQGEFYNRRKDGSCYWEEATIFPIEDNSGEIINFIKIASVINEKKELLAKIEDLTREKSSK